MSFDKFNFTQVAKIRNCHLKVVIPSTGCREKLKFQTPLEYSNKTLFFEEKLLFQRAVENLL